MVIQYTITNKTKNTTVMVLPGESKAIFLEVGDVFSIYVSGLTPLAVVFMQSYLNGQWVNVQQVDSTMGTLLIDNIPVQTPVGQAQPTRVMNVGALSGTITMTDVVQNSGTYTVKNLTKGTQATVGAGQSKTLYVAVGDQIQFFGSGLGPRDYIVLEEFDSGVWSQVASGNVDNSGNFASAVYPIIYDVGASLPTRASMTGFGGLSRTGIVALTNVGGPTDTVTLTFTSSLGGHTVPSQATVYDVGQSVQIQAVADSGYIFIRWDKNGVATTLPANTTVIASADDNYHAIFGSAVTIKSGAGGTTDPRPGTYKVITGQSFQVNMNPNTGYVGDHWLVNGNSVAPGPIVLTIQGPTVVEAFFVQSGTPPPGGKSKSFTMLQSFDLYDPPLYNSVNYAYTLAPWDATKTTVTKAILTVRASATDTSRELSIWTNENSTGVLNWLAGQMNQEKSLQIDVTSYINDSGDNVFRFNYYVTFGQNLAPSHCYISAILTIYYEGDDPVLKPKPPPFTLEWWQWALIGVAGIAGVVVIAGKGGGGPVINITNPFKRGK